MSRREPTPDPAVARELEALDAALAGRAVDPDLADLATLATDLRDGAPRPEPGFAARLDERAAAGFAAARPRPTGARALTARRWFVPAVLSTGAAAVLAVVVAVA